MAPTKVPTRLVYSLTATLILSLFLNITVLFLNSLNDRSVPGLSLPLKIRPAALTMTETGQYEMKSPEDWGRLVPSGRGFARLPSDSGEYRYYQVSMYHQIHCLMGMRLYFNILISGGNLTDHNLEHATHCLSYLDQAMLCSADMTLEPAHTAYRAGSGKHVHSVVAEGVTHKCGDWTQVRGWMEENKAAWPVGDFHFNGENK